MILGFITVPIITHIVDPESYGLFSMTQTYITIIATVCLLGLEQAYVRFFYVEPTIEFKNQLSRRVITIPFVLSILVSISFLMIGDNFMGHGFLTLLFMDICIVTTVIDSFTRLSVRMDQNAKLYSSLLIIHRMVFAISVIVLILVFDIYSVDALLIGTFLSLITVIAAAVFNEKGIWLHSSYNSDSAIPYKELFKYSYPFVFSAIANWVFNAMDKLAIQHYSTYTELGFYAAGANIVALVTVLQTTFTTLWVPIAVENFQKNPENKQFYYKSFNYITVIMIAAGATVVLAKDVFAWVLGGNYTVAKLIFPCLILQPVMFSISEVTVYGINFYKKTYWHIVITFISCIVNFFGNVMLVPIMDGKGAAISTGMSYIVFFTLRTVISQKYYPIHFQFSKFILLLLSLVGFVVYSSFFETNIISVALYILILLLIIIMYRTELNGMVNIIKGFMKKPKSYK